MTDIFLERSRLDAIADAILKIEPCAFYGVVTRDQIVAAIGEAGDIWPMTILSDAIRQDFWLPSAHLHDTL